MSKKYLCRVYNDLATALVQRLSMPLPGKDAQFRMASSFRVPPGFTPDISTARIGGVLIALYADGDVVRTVLMKRPAYQGAHSGQVSFPGGKWEPTDRDIEATALREASEEVAIRPEQVRVLGRLTELYIPASNFLVHPVVGFLEGVPHLVPDMHEVESILKPPVSHFQRKDMVQSRSIQVAEHLTVTAPYYDVDGHVVWGATAMIMSEFVQVLDEVGFAP